MSGRRAVIAGVAAPLPRDNVDTDQIIPKHHLITVDREGMGQGLFSQWRFAADGSERAEFVLNQEPYRHAKILVAGANFGCGSSREHAVWALLDFGIEAVVSSSFASIFEENASKNALATVCLPAPALAALFSALEAARGATMQVDLERCVVIGPDGAQFPFDMPHGRRRALIEGQDEIGLTLARSDRIDAFQDRDRRVRPWVYTVPRRWSE